MKITTIQEFKSMKGFKVISLNVRSLFPKMDNLKLDLLDGEIDIVGCTESWLNSDIPTSMIKVNNYNCFRYDRMVKNKDGKIKKGGGLCTFCKTNINVDEHLYSRFNGSNANFEIHCLKLIQGGSRAMVLINVYRPPNGIFKVLYEKLQDILTELTRLRRTDVICMGDFNIDWSKKSDSRVKQLVALIRKNNLTQSVTIPTRVTSISSSLIDLLFQNVQNVAFANTVSYALSDHNPIALCKKGTKRSQKSKRFEGRSYRDLDIETFCEDICNSDWSKFDNARDPNIAWMEMYCIFLQLTNRHCPIRTYNISSRRPEYIDQEIVALSNDRDFNHSKARLFRKGSSEYDKYWLKSIELRKEVNQKIKSAKREFIVKQFNDSSGNPTKFWRTVSTLLPKQKDSSLKGVFVPDTKDYVRGKEAANAINRFFSSIGTSLNEKLPDPTTVSHTFHFNHQMGDIPVISETSAEREILKINENKSSGLSQINARLLKIALLNQVTRFTKLLNMCIRLSVFPTQWKIGINSCSLAKKGRL